MVVKHKNVVKLVGLTPYTQNNDTPWFVLPMQATQRLTHKYVVGHTMWYYAKPTTDLLFWLLVLTCFVHMDYKFIGTPRCY